MKQNTMMTPDPFIVKTVLKSSDGDRTMTQVWQEATPLAIGHPFRCVLERTPQGVRVRDLQGRVFKLTGEEVERGARMELPDSSVIFLRPATPVTPAYVPKVVSAAQANAPIFAYAGVRRALTTCTAVQAAYVAYSKGKPAFAFYQEAGGFKIKALANGVRLKFKGGTPQIGGVGEVWNLTNEELALATVFKGWYWWRFNRVETPSLPTGKLAELEAENVIFRKISIGILASMAALWLSLQIFVSSPKVDTEANKTTVVVQNKFRVFSKQGARSDSPNTPPVTAASNEPVKTETPPRPTNHAENTHAPTHGAIRPAQPLNNVRQALSSLKAFHGSTHLEAGNPAAAKTASSASLFSGDSGSTIKQTAVAPLASGSGIQVHGFGGKNVNFAQGTPNGSSSTNSFVSLQKSEYRVDEGLSKDEVGEVIHSHLGEIRYCHEAAMLAHPELEGKLVVDFQIDPKGAVSSATVNSSSLNNSQLDDCVMGRLKTWQFPKPRGGVTVSVSYPFLFRVLELNQ